MTTNTLPSGASGKPVINRIVPPAFALLLVGTAGIVGHLLINGSRIAEQEQSRLASEINDENRAFCGRFDAGPSTERFAECAAALVEIRDHAVGHNTDPLI
jgi:hypothetical protein